MSDTVNILVPPPGRAVDEPFGLAQHQTTFQSLKVEGKPGGPRALMLRDGDRETVFRLSPDQVARLQRILAEGAQP
jgi:hypothetical protein